MSKSLTQIQSLNDKHVLDPITKYRTNCSGTYYSEKLCRWIVISIVYSFWAMIGVTVINVVGITVAMSNTGYSLADTVDYCAFDYAACALLSAAFCFIVFSLAFIRAVSPD